MQCFAFAYCPEIIVMFPYQVKKTIRCFDHHSDFCTWCFQKLSVRVIKDFYIPTYCWVSRSELRRCKDNKITKVKYIVYKLALKNSNYTMEFNTTGINWIRFFCVLRSELSLKAKGGKFSRTLHDECPDPCLLGAKCECFRVIRDAELAWQRPSLSSFSKDTQGLCSLECMRCRAGRW